MVGGLFDSISRRWRIPKNLRKVYNYWSSKEDFFTRKPVEWRWFYAWLSKPNTVPARIDQKSVKAILKDFGHPTPININKLKQPPEDLKNRLNAFMGLRVVESSKNLEGVVAGQRQEIEELKSRNNELEKQVDKLLTANEKQMLELDALQRQTKCEDLRKLLDEKKATAPIPPPPRTTLPEPVTQQEEEQAVEKSKKSRVEFEAAITGPPPPPPRDDKPEEEEEDVPPPLPPQDEDNIPVPPPQPTAQQPKSKGGTGGVTTSDIQNRSSTLRKTEKTQPQPPRDDIPGQLEQAMKARRGSMGEEDDPDDDPDVTEDEWNDGIARSGACIVCNAPAVGSCSQCFQRTYCGEVCQRYDWITYHAHRCRSQHRETFLK